jgi:hypothetical protein
VSGGTRGVELGGARWPGSGGGAGELGRLEVGDGADSRGPVDRETRERRPAHKAQSKRENVFPVKTLPSWFRKGKRGPPSPCVSRLFIGNTFSLLDHAFRAGHLSLVSLSTRPQLLAPSPTSYRPSSPAPPPLPGHRAPPSSTPRVPPDRCHLTFIFPPLIPLLPLPRLQWR